MIPGLRILQEREEEQAKKEVVGTIGNKNINRPPFFSLHQDERKGLGEGRKENIWGPLWKGQNRVWGRGVG